MTFDKVLVFDISGDYAHFRKFNTTTSPLTYCLPSRPTLAGLLGAVLGVEREIGPNDYPAGVVPVNELFHPERCALAIRLIHPVNKSRIGFNLINTKNSFFNISPKAGRTQIEYEFLKDPLFRVYLYHDQPKIMEELTERIRDNRPYFSPYFGLAQLAAQFSYRGTKSCELRSATGYVRIDSAVNLSALTGKNPIRFGEGFYSVDTFPNLMRRDRTVENYAEILVERGGANGPGLTVACPEFYCVGDSENILLL